MRGQMKRLSLVGAAVCSLLMLAHSMEGAVRQSVDRASDSTERAPKWITHGRVAGLSVSLLRTTDFLIRDWMDGLVDQGVNVFEGDSRFSEYLTDAEFDEHVALVKRFCTIAHEKGVRVVWYIPSLEVITPNAAISKNSMARDHPDWIQLGFNRKDKAYFVGQKCFWVEPKDESAWMCPNGPYRDYFFKRLKRLATSGLDAIWLDVPILGLFTAQWACADVHCRAKFEKETGLVFPSRVDLSNPTFLRFVRWRHETLADFLKDATRTIKSVDPKMVAVTEIVACDNLLPLETGQDATYFTGVDGLFVVWEVDALSDTTGMANAKLDDWFILMSTYKFCHGASWPAPSWAFSYGWKPFDANLVMASCLAAQVGPYEVKVPQMCSSVGKPFRTKMYHWVKANTNRIFDSDSGAEAAILYSSASRDFLDGARLLGNFASWAAIRRDMHWSATEFSESAYNTQYMGEYRGWAKLLIRNGIPFDIVPLNRATSERLKQYRYLILPEAAVLSDEEHALALKWVRNGGNLLVTGSNPGGYTTDGRKRRESIWASCTGGKPGSCNRVGSGNVQIWEGLPGREYLRKNRVQVETRATDLLRQVGIKSLLPRREPVYVQTYRKDRTIILHAVHYGWINGQINAEPTQVTAHFEVPLPVGFQVRSVVCTSPDQAESEIPFTVKGGSVSFDAKIGIHGLFVIR